MRVIRVVWRGWVVSFSDVWIMWAECDCDGTNVSGVIVIIMNGSGDSRRYISFL